MRQEAPQGQASRVTTRHRAHAQCQVPKASSLRALGGGLSAPVLGPAMRPGQPRRGAETAGGWAGFPSPYGLCTPNLCQATPH